MCALVGSSDGWQGDGESFASLCEEVCHVEISHTDMGTLWGRFVMTGRC